MIKVKKYFSLLIIIFLILSYVAFAQDAYSTSDEHGNNNSVGVKESGESNQESNQGNTQNEVNSKEKDIITNYDAEINILKEKIERMNKIILETTNIINELTRKENLLGVYNLKIESIKEKTKKSEDIIKQNLSLKEEINKLTNQINDLTKKLVTYNDLSQNYITQKNEFDLLNKKKNEFEIKKAVLENEIDNLNKDLKKINNDLMQIDDAKKKINNYAKIQDFLETDFVNILETIEKKIMLKIKNDFESFFQKWFYMLIDSDIIKIRLDDEFTPLIEQAGHEIEYINLSGGEKTAAALAYRLALNQIINTFVSEIKTKDLLILDEPTDGFSSEQLDRLRQVFEELNTNQIIIVSHENKIESFADRIIKLTKQDHITRIV